MAYSESACAPATALSSEPIDAEQPLPTGWLSVPTEAVGGPYFYHETSRRTTWTRPRRSHAASILPAGATEDLVGDELTYTQKWDDASQAHYYEEAMSWRRSWTAPLHGAVVWRECWDELSQSPYYFNETTSATSWIDPSTASVAAASAAPAASAVAPTLRRRVSSAARCAPPRVTLAEVRRRSGAASRRSATTAAEEGEDSAVIDARAACRSYYSTAEPAAAPRGKGSRRKAGRKKTTFGGGGTKCQKCLQKVYAADKQMKVEAKVWHMACFTCSFPGHDAMLSLQGFTIAAGKPYCKTHYLQMFHERGNYDSLMGTMKHPALEGTRRRSSLSHTVLAAAERSRRSRTESRERERASLLYINQMS